MNDLQGYRLIMRLIQLSSLTEVIIDIMPKAIEIFIFLIDIRNFVEACNCEVSEWTNWSTTCSVTCGRGELRRSRVCSEKNGWTFGLSCHKKDEHTVWQHIDCNTQKCRKFF